LQAVDEQHAQHDGRHDRATADDHEPRPAQRVRFGTGADGPEGEGDDGDPDDDRSGGHPPEDICQRLSLATRRVERRLDAAATGQHHRARARHTPNRATTQARDRAVEQSSQMMSASPPSPLGDGRMVVIA
jgi:hypothetical protein